MEQLNLKKLTTVLFIFIISLIFVSVFSFFYMLKEQEYNGRIINISGRQRMLSQKLTKEALLIIQNSDSATSQTQKNRLQLALNKFKELHETLIYGNEELHIAKNSSEEIKKLFKQIQPYFDTTVNNIEKILKSQNTAITRNNIEAFMASQKSNITALQTILKNEGKFLVLMNQIVSKYEEQNHTRITILKLIILITSGLIILIILLVGFIINESTKNRLLLIQKAFIIREQNEELKTSAEELGKNNKALRKLNSEVNLQKEYLVGVNQDLADSMGVAKEQKRVIELAHEKINSSLKYAKNLQDSLLPEQSSVSEHLNDYFVLYKPKDIVSGDFYYVNKIENTLLFTVGDCTGHSVPGAFMTMLSLTFIDEIIRREIQHIPANILEQLRVRIKEIFKKASSYNQNGLDIAFCVLDTQTNILQYAGAYNPLWIIRQSELIEYKGTRAPIGNHPKHIDFENTEIQLENDDLIYLFSDGYYDQFGGEQNTKFGKKVFKKLILEIQNLTLEEQKEVLDKRLFEWQKESPQTDDITVMGIKWVC